MSISGTRGLVRVSKNSECLLQAAMAVERKKEPDFYRGVTGEEYLGEYGERFSARRRGTKFEAYLHENDAGPLRKAVGPLYGLDPDAMVVRNFANEVPGPPSTMRAIRLGRMRLILKDLVAGREVPHLVIQPQLALPTGGHGQFEYVSPDFMVLDPNHKIYVPGEEKSFITRDNVAEPGDLDLTRRQAAAQILGLRAEAGLHGIAERVANRAVFVFATPYGLHPAPAVEERLHAEVHEIHRALAAYTQVRALLARLRAHGDVKLELLVDELPFHFQEECYRSCIMAGPCEKRHAGTARMLGDDAADLLGAATDLRRINALLAGAEPADPEERELVAKLQAAGSALGFDDNELRRRLA